MSLLLARALARSRTPIVLHHLHSEGRWAALEHALLRRADAVITISGASRAQLLEAGVDARRIHLVHPGVGMHEARDPSLKGRWPAPGLRLLYLSRLIDRKRPDLALYALALLRDRGIPASLVIGGDGPLRGRLEGLVAELGLENQVAFAGFVNEATKWRLIDSSQVFVFPSELEGFGFAAAEAQARGIPVVAVAGTATEEIVADGETGFVTAPTPKAFADAIALLANETRRRQMAERAATTAKRWEWRESAHRVAEVYRSVATAPSRVGA